MPIPSTPYHPLHTIPFTLCSAYSPHLLVSSVTLALMVSDSKCLPRTSLLAWSSRAFTWLPWRARSASNCCGVCSKYMCKCLHVQFSYTYSECNNINIHVHVHECFKAAHNIHLNGLRLPPPSSLLLTWCFLIRKRTLWRSFPMSSVLRSLSTSFVQVSSSSVERRKLCSSVASFSL